MLYGGAGSDTHSLQDARTDGAESTNAPGDALEFAGSRTATTTFASVGAFVQTPPVHVADDSSVLHAIAGQSQSVTTTDVEDDTGEHDEIAAQPRIPKSQNERGRGVASEPIRTLGRRVRCDSSIQEVSSVVGGGAGVR